MAIVLVLLSVAAACGREEPITADDLVDACRAAGLDYAVRETAALAGICGHGVRLWGEGLSAEVYSVPVAAQFNMVAVAAREALLADGVGAKFPSQDLIMRRPYIVIVRAEPEAGRLRNMLDTLLSK
jgi:hypothetical protein